MKFRKKPLVIEAVTWYGKYTSPGEWPEWFNAAVKDGTIWLNLNGHLRIKTLAGAMTVGVGDKIIRGIRGELYPVEDDIFRETYEPEPPAEFDPAYPAAARSIP